MRTRILLIAAASLVLSLSTHDAKAAQAQPVNEARYTQSVRSDSQDPNQRVDLRTRIQNWFAAQGAAFWQYYLSYVIFEQQRDMY